MKKIALMIVVSMLCAVATAEEKEKLFSGPQKGEEITPFKVIMVNSPDDVKEVEIIGEAAYQIAQATRDNLPEIPWEDIVGMRHRLVHAYFDINLNILWRTVQEDLPVLVAALKSVMPAE